MGDNTGVMRSINAKILHLDAQYFIRQYLYGKGITMNYKPSVLNCTSGLLVLISIIWLVIDYKILSEGEGWGLIGVIMLFGVAFISIYVDLFLQYIIKNRKWLNFFEAALVLCALGFFFYMQYFC